MPTHAPPSPTRAPGPSAGRSTRMRRGLVVATAALLVATACQAQAEVEIAASTAAVAPTPATAATVSPEPAEPEPTAPPVADASDGDESDDAAADAGDAAVADTEPSDRFVLEGDLGLSTAEVVELIDFIEAETGRPFLRPPTIVAQSQADFEAGLAPDDEDLDDFNASLDWNMRYLQSMGLTEQGVQEAGAAFLALLTSSDTVLGYYDPEIDKLYVPNNVDDVDAFTSTVLHELTHALDAQYIDLTLEERSDEAEATGNFEPQVVFLSVIEGRATAMEERWSQATGVTPAEPDLDDLSLLATVPPAFVLSLSLPYSFGPIFIEANGGPAGTWDLLENPPLSTEEIFVPDIALGEEPITEVPVPAADGTVLKEVVFGASDILVWLLGESLSPDPNGAVVAFSALDGWAGGSAVIWGDESQSCTRIAIASDSAQDRDEIEAAAQGWAERGEVRTVELVDDLVVITGCAPYIP